MIICMYVSITKQKQQMITSFLLIILFKMFLENKTISNPIYNWMIIW